MEFISQLINLIKQPWLLTGALFAMGGWLVLSIACCVFGAVAFYAMGRAKELKPYLPAFLPGGQIWYTLKLTGKDRDAHLAEHLLWWCPALMAAALAVVAWAAYYYLDEAFAVVWWLLALMAILAVLALVAYVWVRVLEFRVLFGLLKRWEWYISLVGTLFLIPLQRIILFAEHKKV